MWADSSYDRNTCYGMINVRNNIPQSIVIKEVTIKSSLHGSSNPSDPVTVHLFSVVAGNPVQNIEGSVESEENHVAGGEILDFLVLLKHYDLRHDANGLQVDGERPSVLSEQAKRMTYIEYNISSMAVEENSQDSSGDDGQLDDIVRISFSVVSLTVGTYTHHHVRNVKGERNVNHLHNGVVQNHWICQLAGMEKNFVQIQVSCDIYDEVESLRLEGNTYN